MPYSGLCISFGVKLGHGTDGKNTNRVDVCKDINLTNVLNDVEQMENLRYEIDLAPVDNYIKLAAVCYNVTLSRIAMPVN